MHPPTANQVTGRHLERVLLSCAFLDSGINARFKAAKNQYLLRNMEQMLHLKNENVNFYSLHNKMRT